ncbi:MAG TPA: Flp family type IVb pilin [Dongiaceae bacterium]|nr:Flp family type IVb pilin [Dongiaceae bacterium]
MTRHRHGGPRRAGSDELGFGAAEAGATAIEYALIAALVSVFIVGAISFTGNGVKTTYNVIINAVLGAVNN